MAASRTVSISLCFSMSTCDQCRVGEPKWMWWREKEKSGSALPKLEPECRHQLRIYPKAVFSPDRWRLSRDAKLYSFIPIQSYSSMGIPSHIFYCIVIKAIARVTSLYNTLSSLTACECSAFFREKNTRLSHLYMPTSPDKRDAHSSSAPSEAIDIRHCERWLLD